MDADGVPPAPPLRRRDTGQALRFVGGNRVTLLEGGDQLFPRMIAAIGAAQAEVWLATYIFHDDPAAQSIADALIATAARGVPVHVIVDGFGSLATLAAVRARFAGSAVRLEVFRPLERWWAWLQPGQLRRLHQKLCVCDARTAFIGGINLIDDRHDLHHGWGDEARLDYAVEVEGPLSESVRAAARAVWLRAQLARGWRIELRLLARSAHPVGDVLALVRQLRGTPAPPPAAAAALDTEPDAGGDARAADASAASGPMQAAFVVRDNLRQRRAIERSYVQAILGARRRVDIAVPYFYPGARFRRALRRAARRGVHVRLLLQGKVDYRLAALAAQAVYDELRGAGVRIFEYTPAFLHAKVALVDDDWATVGSSNIDPLSLLLNLEANVVVRDAGFTRALAARLDAAFAVSHEIAGATGAGGLRGWAGRALVAWFATVYLRLAGITGRY